jgi:uncharacterized protein YggE
MHCRTTIFVLAGWLIIALAPATGWAQYGAFLEGQPSQKGAITGTGTAVENCRPTALRMHVELLAKGKTPEEAMAKLKDLSDAARLQVEALGAAKGSIELSSPRLSESQSQQKKQFEMMVRQRLSARGRKMPKGLQTPQSTTVSLTLTAEWPLESQSDEKLILATEGIKNKIMAAKLGGAEEAESLSPEEEEMAEETALMMANSGEEQIKPGEPQFLYVARFSDEQRNRAMTEAFNKAKNNAAELAQAAGVKLGPLVALSGGGGGNVDFNSASYGTYRYAQQEYLQRLLGGQGPFGLDATTNEAMSMDPSSLKLNCRVAALFSIQQ